LFCFLLFSFLFLLFPKISSTNCLFLNFSFCSPLYNYFIPHIILISLFIQKFLFHILFKRSPAKYFVPRYSSFIKDLCSTYSIKLVQLNLFLDAFFCSTRMYDFYSQIH
jgi:hypothetical protein